MWNGKIKGEEEGEKGWDQERKSSKEKIYDTENKIGKRTAKQVWGKEKAMYRVPYGSVPLGIYNLFRKEKK